MPSSSGCLMVLVIQYKLPDWGLDQSDDDPIDPHEHVVKHRRPVVALHAGKDLDSM